MMRDEASTLAQDCNWNHIRYETDELLSKCGTILLIEPFSLESPSLEYAGELCKQLVEELNKIPGITAIMVSYHWLELYIIREINLQAVRTAVEIATERLNIPLK